MGLCALGPVCYLMGIGARVKAVVMLGPGWANAPSGTTAPLHLKLFPCPSHLGPPHADLFVLLHLPPDSVGRWGSLEVI